MHISFYLQVQLLYKLDTVSLCRYWMCI